MRPVPDEAHRYVTNVLDAQTHQLLLMVEGRRAAALEAFAQALVAHGGRSEQIALISVINGRRVATNRA
jgi:hypothetical protein